VFESIQKRQHHERVGLEPGPRADRLGLLHELLGQAFVAEVQMDGGEAIIAGEEQPGPSGILGQLSCPRPRFTDATLRCAKTWP
jgi:hypothetical protein